MTEAEWQNVKHPWLLLENVEDLATNERRLQLFACGCCRLIWHLIDREECRQAIEVVELYAEGLASEETLDDAYTCAGNVAISAANKSAVYAAISGRAHSFFDKSLALAVATCASDAVVMPLGIEDLEAFQAADLAEKSKQCNIFRDIFGNPFRPSTLDPLWLTSTVVALAQGIYSDRTFDRMPILADALQDAGCETTEILNHCRGDGTHVKGCWVLDLVLGKE